MNNDHLLYERLKAYALNLHTLSERSGVAYSTVYNLFTGKKNICDATSETLYKLARFTGMSMDELYRALEYPPSKKQAVFPDFFLMWEDEVIASVKVGDKEVYADRFILHPVKQIFYADKVPRFIFGQILKDRCFDENRADCKSILHSIGLNEYNPYEICKITHGKMVQDKTWFKFEGETMNYRTLIGGVHAS